MPKCVKIRRKKRQVCIGDLDTEIILSKRSIKGLTTSDPNFDESFTAQTTVWAMVETVSGETGFDGTNTEVVITDRFYVRYDPSVDAETWIELDGINYRIINTTDLDRRRQFTLINATIRGDKVKPVNLS